MTSVVYLCFKPPALIGVVTGQKMNKVLQLHHSFYESVNTKTSGNFVLKGKIKTVREITKNQ